MSTLIAVIKDLWDFCFGNQLPAESVVADVVVESKLAQPSLGEKHLDEQRLVKPNLPDINFSTFGEKFYILSNEANVFQRPVWTFDGVLLRLPYSASVQVLGYEGRFARVEVENRFGFVLKDDLTSNVLDVFPQLQTGEIYSSNHPDTKKIRRIIKDEFFATEMFLPLQAIEFAVFRLKCEGRTISWPDIRPRLAGSWQNILKGRLGVQIGVMPKTGAIIEYTKSDGSGYVGYTKSVHVDESIVIEGIGRLIEGEYREEAVSKEQWQEWRPVWIQIQ